MHCIWPAWDCHLVTRGILFTKVVLQNQEINYIIGIAFDILFQRCLFPLISLWTWFPTFWKCSKQWPEVHAASSVHLTRLQSWLHCSSLNYNPTSGLLTNPICSVCVALCVCGMGPTMHMPLQPSIYTRGAISVRVCAHRFVCVCVCVCVCVYVCKYVCECLCVCWCIQGCIRTCVCVCLI